MKMVLFSIFGGNTRYIGSPLLLSFHHCSLGRWHYPHVTWAHVMLSVRLGCDSRFNIEFYGADSHFCHSAYVKWSRVELWSAHVPAREPTRAPREITWRRQSDSSV